jgi:hypothetical protein
LEVSNARALKRINRERDGRGGTRPQVVAQDCVEHHIIGHTEGIHNDLSTNPMITSSLGCSLIQTAEEDRLDASVIAPFIRRFPHHVLIVTLNAREPIILASGDALDELLDEMQSIHSSVDFQGKIRLSFLGDCCENAWSDQRYAHCMMK